MFVLGSSMGADPYRYQRRERLSVVISSPQIFVLGSSRRRPLPASKMGTFVRCDTVTPKKDGRGWRPRQPVHVPSPQAFVFFGSSMGADPYRYYKWERLSVVMPFPTQTKYTNSPLVVVFDQRAFVYDKHLSAAFLRKTPRGWGSKGTPLACFLWFVSLSRNKEMNNK